MLELNQIAIALALGLIIALVVHMVWNTSFGTSDETTTKAIFEENFEIREMPQIHSLDSDKHETAFGLREMSVKYRAYNPSLVRYHRRTYFLYRVSNYVGCRGDLSRPKDPISKIQSFIIVSVGRQVYDVELEDKARRLCPKGFEDPRPIIDRRNRMMYAAVNARSGTGCKAEMWIIGIPLKELKVGGKRRTAPKMVRPTHTVKLIPTWIPRASLTHEKNWMPFMRDDKLHLVYSVNPHIIVECDMESGECRKVAETFNPELPADLRGGSQVKRYGNLYIGVVHVRRTSNSYLTRFYAFNTSYPFEVRKLSSPFIFDDERDVARSSVQFVSGLEIDKDTAHVTYGENDCHSKMCTIPMREIMKSLEDVDRRNLSILNERSETEISVSSEEDSGTFSGEDR